MSDRKIGNNKEACKIYKASGRLERNKKRNKARAERQATRTKARIARRIKAGKKVPTHHLAEFAGTSKGTSILLGGNTTFAGCDAYASKHGLKGTSECVEVNGKQLYRLVDVRRAA